MMKTRLTFAAALVTGLSTAALGQQPPDESSANTEQKSFATVDANGDGRLSRAETGVVAGFDFSHADTNGDASLTRQEFAAALTAPIRGDDSDASRNSRADDKAARSNGKDQRARNDSAVRVRSPEGALFGEGAAWVSFETVDRNKDGRVNRAEASEIPGFDFSRADINDDAALTRQEFQTAMAGAQPRG